MNSLNRFLTIVVLLTVAIMLVLVYAPRSEAGTSDATLIAVETGGQTGTYIVQRGDTLHSIAQEYNTTVGVLMQLNGIRNPNWIYVGQRLTVPLPALPQPENVWTDPATNIELFSPVANTVYHSPIEVIGYSTTFEGTVNIELRDEAGNVIAERHTMGGALGDFSFFHSYVRFTTQDQQAATLDVFEISPVDGSRLHVVQIPLTILPGQRFVDLNTPAVGAEVCDPIIGTGYSDTFEANVLVDLHQRDGTVIESQFAFGGNFGIYRDFSATFDYSDPLAQPLLVSAYEANGIGLGHIDQTRVPITYMPLGCDVSP